MEDYSDFYFGKYKKERENKEKDETYSHLGDERKPHVEDTRKIEKKEKIKQGFKHKYLTVICVLCISVALLFLSVEYFSPIGIVNEIKSFSKSETKGFSLYAVSFGTFENLEAARNSAMAIRSSGGGGYILFDGVYNVLASAYKSEEEASKIANINTAKVVEIKITPPSEKDFSIKIRDSAKKTFSFKESLFETLYDISTKLDLGEITKEEAIARIKIARDDFKLLIEDYIDNYKQDGNDKALSYCAKLTTALELLNNLLNEKLERPSLLADIRYSYLVIVNL